MESILKLWLSYVLFLLSCFSAYCHCEGNITLQSNLNFTSRSHACIGETIFFTCSGGEGDELEWNVANTQLILPSTQESFDAEFSNSVTAYIFLAESLPNTTFRRFTSNALFEVSAGTTPNFDVSCEVLPSAGTAPMTLGVSGELLHILKVYSCGVVTTLYS